MNTLVRSLCIFLSVAGFIVWCTDREIVEHSQVTPAANVRQGNPIKVSESVHSLGSQKDYDLPVEYGDSIYLKGDWDASPIVMESHKLIFFTTAKVACTQWKMLFRRMMGYSNWNVEEYTQMLPWNPQTNGLKYLYDYDREVASNMLTSPEWTKAIFVREPKSRFLSAYLDKAVAHETYLYDACWSSGSDAISAAKRSPSKFLDLAYFCDDQHWKPQSRRLPEKYWPYINFVGHFETLEEDAKRLLEHLNAWEQFGASGWGANGDESLFDSGTHAQHETNATISMKSYLSPELVVRLDDFYSKDYSCPLLNITKIEVH